MRKTPALLSVSSTASDTRRSLSVASAWERSIGTSAAARETSSSDRATPTLMSQPPFWLGILRYWRKTSRRRRPRTNALTRELAWRVAKQPSSHLGGRLIKNGHRGDIRPDCEGAGRGRRRVPGADRAAPPRAHGALLPDAGIFSGCRGRAAGDAARGVAGPRQIRGTRLASHLALRDCHQPLPQLAALGQPTTGEDVGRA